MIVQAINAADAMDETVAPKSCALETTVSPPARVLLWHWGRGWRGRYIHV